MNKRRFLSITAGALSATALSCSRRPERQVWRGILFGTEVSFEVRGLSGIAFEALSTKVVAEMTRLEGLFSLYQESSQLSELNREGLLISPDPDFVALLELSHSISNQSDGLFDPTIQSCWQAARAGGVLPLALVDYRGLVIAPEKVTLRPGQQVTLNGIAQGFIADRVGDLLRKEGLLEVLINMGEYKAVGGANDSWPIQIEGVSQQEILKGGEALAVSSGSGFLLPAQRNHLLHPRSGISPHSQKRFWVLAPTAAEADALSTAYAVANEGEEVQLKKAFPKARFS